MSATPRFSRDFTVSIGTSSSGGDLRRHLVVQHVPLEDFATARLDLVQEPPHDRLALSPDQLVLGRPRRRLRVLHVPLQSGSVLAHALLGAREVHPPAPQRRRPPRPPRGRMDRGPQNSMAACCRRSSASAAEVRSLRAISAGFFVCSTRNATLRRSTGSVPSRRLRPARRAGGGGGARRQWARRS
jgi:hypothetical protein